MSRSFLAFENHMQRNLHAWIFRRMNLPTPCSRKQCGYWRPFNLTEACIIRGHMHARTAGCRSHMDVYGEHNRLLENFFFCQVNYWTMKQPVTDWNFQNKSFIHFARKGDFIEVQMWSDDIYKNILVFEYILFEKVVGWTQVTHYCCLCFSCKRNNGQNNADNCR